MLSHRDQRIRRSSEYSAYIDGGATPRAGENKENLRVVGYETINATETLDRVTFDIFITVTERSHKSERVAVAKLALR